MSILKNNIRIILLFLVVILLSTTLTLFSLYDINNFYLSTSLFSINIFIGIKIINTIIIHIYRRIEHINNLFYPYIIIRAIRLPIITLLYIWFLKFLIFTLSKEFEPLAIYSDFIYSVFSYVIIFTFSWSAWRISHKIKERKISEYFIYNKSKDIDEEQKNKLKYKTTNIETGFKILNFSIFIFTLVAIVNTATGSTSALITFAGGLIIVFGLAARDFLSNFFGGFMIYINRPFEIGDLIKSPDKDIEGVVQEIGWMAVKVQTPDKRPLYIPNSLFSNLLVENSSRMNNRAIRESFKFNIEHFNEISKLCKAIKAMLKEHQGIDQEHNIIVNITNFSNNYVEVSIICFTKTIELQGYYSIKQNILSKSYKIIQEQNIKLAEAHQNVRIINN